MRSIAVIVACLMCATAHAQMVLHRTNEVGMTIQDHTLTMNQGSMRLNIRVTEAGSFKNMGDITTFRATAKDLTDGRIVQTVTQDTTGTENDASQGQVRFVFSTLTDRGIDPDYEIEAYAVAASDTNQNYRIHWGYLSVTSAPSGSTINLRDIVADSVSATDGTYSNLTVGGVLDFAGAISAIDVQARTQAILRVGSNIHSNDMQGNLDFAGLYAPTNIYDGSFTGTASTIEYVDDSVAGVSSLSNAVDILVAATPVNYSGSGNVEGDLAAIDTVLGSLSGGSGDAYLSNTQTWFGANTFSNRIYLAGGAWIGGEKGGIIIQSSGSPSIYSNNTNTLIAFSSGGIIGGGSASDYSGIMFSRNNSIISQGSRSSAILASGRSVPAQIADAEDALVAASSASQILSGGTYVSAIATYDSDNSGIAAFVAGSYYSDNTARQSVILAGNDADNDGDYSLLAGHEINNAYKGVFVWRGYDGTSTEVSSTASNQVLFFTQGFGIGTNAPRERLDVNGAIQLTTIKLMASGTNLWLTDSMTYTNAVNITPL